MAAKVRADFDFKFLEDYDIEPPNHKRAYKKKIELFARQQQSHLIES